MVTDSTGKSKARRRREQKVCTKDRARRKLRNPAYLSQEMAKDPRHVGLHAATPTSCSCWMCGNQRRHGKGKNRLTSQERRADSGKAG